MHLIDRPYFQSRLKELLSYKFLRPSRTSTPGLAA
jgi:hypothetical protein